LPLQPLSDKEARVARLLACLDFRLEEDRGKLLELLGYSEKHVDGVLRRLRGMGLEVAAQHIRDIRPLGLASIIVRGRRREALDQATRLWELRGRVPRYRYLYGYRVLMDNSAVYSYLAPVDAIDEFYGDIERGLVEGGGGALIDAGFTVPVRPDCGADASTDPGAALSDAEVEEAARRLEEAPPSLRHTLLDVMVYAALDLNPMRSIRDLLNVSDVVAERLEEPAVVKLNKRKTMQRYTLLSRQRLVGRVMIARAVWRSHDLLPIYLEARRECAPQLYAAVAKLWASPNIFVGSEVAAVVMLLPEDAGYEVQRLLGDCVTYSNILTRGFGTCLPVEMYDPRGSWVVESDEPRYDLLRVLQGKGIAVVEKKGKAAGEG